MAEHKSTETIERCTIQERTAYLDNKNGKRWVVTWKANDEAKPVNIVCRAHGAAYALADALNSPDVLWPCD